MGRVTFLVGAFGLLVGVSPEAGGAPTPSLAITQVSADRQAGFETTNGVCAVDALVPPAAPIRVRLDILNVRSR